MGRLDRHPGSFSRRSLKPFAALAAVLPAFAISGGCGGDMGTVVGDVTGGRLGGGSKQMEYVEAGAKAVGAATLSEAEAAKIGESVALALINQYGLSADDTLNAYVTKVGLAVAAVSSRSDIDYTFGVLETAEPNAFSTPGGFVFVTRGALALMRDESELAGVLAHEIGHITEDHGRKAIQQSGLLAAGAQAVTADDQARLFRGVADKSVEVLQSPHSQAAELSADAEAVKLLRRAGYDPNGLARYLSRVKAGGAAKAFATHPVNADRVAKVQAQAGAATGETLESRFKANVGTN
jgi:predicted Zn-dependent protease